MSPHTDPTIYSTWQKSTLVGPVYPLPRPDIPVHAMECSLASCCFMPRIHKRTLNWSSCMQSCIVQPPIDGPFDELCPRSILLYALVSMSIFWMKMVVLVLTITLVWTVRSPASCERAYKNCVFKSEERFECHFQRLQCIYIYCVDIRKTTKAKTKPLAASIATCLVKYSIPSPMWIDPRK
ncbi:hypothetical protein ScPMuIL_016913 [Solemya velum]